MREQNLHGIRARSIIRMMKAYLMHVLICVKNKEEITGTNETHDGEKPNPEEKEGKRGKKKEGTNYTSQIEINSI